jgi:heptosyltransferase III
MNPARPIAPDEAARAERVLAINVTRIGDTLLATPALRALAAFFPNARITALGHPKRVEVLEHLPFLSKVGKIDKRRALLRGWKDVFAGPEYDYAFVWGEDPALVRYALRKSRHVIAATQRDASLDARLYVVADMPPREQVHALAWTYALTDAVGIPRQGYKLEVAVSQAEREAMTLRLRQAGLSGANTRPLIGLQVASFPTKPYRDWPIEHFISLAGKIRAAYPEAFFICFGGAADESKIRTLTDALDRRALSFAGKFSLRQTIAAMRHLDLYIGVDTGPTHLFGALQKPMIALYHPALPSARFRALEHSALWAVDHRLAGATADEKIPIGEISVETVFAAVRGALDGKPSTLPGMAPAGIS